MAEKPTFVRKHVFINRQLQGHYMLTFLIPMLVMLAFWLFTLYFATQSIMDTTLSIIRKDVDSKIAAQFQDQIQPTIETARALVDDVTKYLRKFSKDKKNRDEVLSSLLWIFGAGIFLVIIQIVLLTIFFSHKVAGPIYRFEKACHSMIEGNYTESIRLRKGDEMQNLATLLNEVMVLTRDRLAALRSATTEEERKKAASSLILR